MVLSLVVPGFVAVAEEPTTGPLGTGVTEPYYWVDYEYSEENQTIAFIVSLYNNPGVYTGQLRFYAGTGTILRPALNCSATSDNAQIVANAAAGISIVSRAYANNTGTDVIYTFSELNTTHNGELFRMTYALNSSGVAPDTYEMVFQRPFNWNINATSGATGRSVILVAPNTGKTGTDTNPTYNFEYDIGDASQNIPVSSISLDNDTLVFRVGESGEQLTATVLPADATQKLVEWSSSATSVATVSEDGIVTPRGVGTATITATARGDATKTATCEVTVGKSVTSVRFDERNRFTEGLKIGGTYQLVPTVNPPDAMDSAVTYSSEDENVATVSGTGLVSAVGLGHTVVWVTTSDGGFKYPMQIWVLADSGGDVASVGGASYASLDVAVAAAKSGETIVLLKDQEYSDILALPDGVSLDLDGHKFYVKQIRVSEGFTIPSISNGTIISIPPTNLDNLYDSTIMLMNKTTLENLSNVTIIHEGGNELNHCPIGLNREGANTTVLERFENCTVTARWVDGMFKPGDAPAIIYNSAGIVRYINNNVVTTTNGAFMWCGTATASDAIVYGGTFNVDAIKMSAGNITIYGGDYNVSPSSAWLAKGYRVESSNGRYTVVKGGVTGELTINVTPVDAVLKLEKIDGGTKTVVNTKTESGGQRIYNVEVDAEYEYTLSATAFTTKTGSIPISFETTTMSINLVAAPGEGGTTNPTTPGSIKGGDFITAGGVYQLEQPNQTIRYGVVTIATREPVTLVGYGVSAPTAMFKDLTIDCASGVNLTIRDLWVNNNAGQGTASGPTNMGVNILNFTGGGNLLQTEGVCLLENQDYVQGAGIHVPPGADLTFAGNGTLYVYKYSQGCGIGGNANEACGTITFASGDYFIKGSKTGAVIGGDAQGSARNGNITFAGANVVVINEAMGDAIGESNQGTCGGDVYISGGNLTTITLWRGDAISSRGTLYFTGGSYKPIMTSNALTGSGNTHFVNDRAVTDKKLSNGKAASLFTFDTTMLTKTTSNFTVSGVTRYSGGLHDYEYSGANSTIASFQRVANDKNLYFYLPMEKDMKLTVNGETFIVSWNATTKTFDVTTPSGDTVSGSGGTSDATTNDTTEPEVTEKIESETKVDDTTATSTTTTEKVKESIEAAAENNATSLVMAAELTGDNANDVKKFVIELPTAGADAIVAANLDLIVETPAGTVKLPTEVLQTIAAAEGEGNNIQIIIEKNDDTTVSIHVIANGTEIASFGGNIKMTLPVPDDLRVPLASGPSGLSGKLQPHLTVIRFVDDAEEIVQKSMIVDYTAHFLLDAPGTLQVVNNGRTYGDVALSDWFYNEASFAASHKLMNGTAADVFNPDAPMTRAMLVTVLFRLESEPNEASNTLFNDLKADWYTDAVNWAAVNKIVNGISAGVFAPEVEITREELATMLYRYAGEIGMNTSATADLSVYTDGGDTSTWAANAMKWAVGSGIITGTSATTLDAQGTASRAQVATMLTRLISMMVR